MTGRPCFMRSCCGIFGRFHIVRHFLSMSQFHHLNKRGNYMTPGGLFQGLYKIMNQFSSVAQSCPTLCDPCIAACQASLFITNSWSLLKFMSIESMMPSNHLTLCQPLLLLPSIPPSISVFSNESTLRMRWPKCWSFSFSISPSKEHPGLICFRMD